MNGWLADILGTFAHILWPSSCPICGMLCRAVCDECLARLSPCEIEAFAEDAGIARVRGAAHYDAQNRELIHRMKFGGVRAVASALGRRMAEVIDRPNAELLVPVPLHKGSDRYFNQAALIARAAASVWDMPVLDALAWSGYFERRSTLDRSDERKLPKGAIICKRNVPHGATVCLVDDIYTTGNTLRAAREALEQAGARVVEGVVWSVSRAPRSDIGGI